ncbi:MAG: metallophosphoesterase [bacterium]
MKIKSGFLYFLLFLLFFYSLNSFKFIAVSDLHVGGNNCLFWNEKKRVMDNGKLMVRDKLLKDLSDNNDIDLILMVGDLTENGIKQGETLFENQWKGFVYNWLTPIAQKIGIEKIGLCVGNHDAGCPSWWDDYNSETLYENFCKVKKINYSFLLKDVLFICCGIYPTEEIRKELKNFLTNVDMGVPIIIFFHYSIFQDCHRMDDYVRKDFYNTIKNHNVIGIINGHFHRSFSMKWCNIPIIGVGGHSYTICSVSEDNRLTTEVVYAKKQRFGRSCSI